jgi:tellurite resistance protein
MKGPLGGRRRLDVIVRFIDLDNPPPMRLGLQPTGHPGLLWSSTILTLDFEFEGKGFQETSQEQEESLAAAVRVAVFMAMADGELHESEGTAIKAWMTRTLSGISESRRPSIKERLNSTFKEAFEQARRGDLDLEDALCDLEDIEDVAIKYQVLQLAFDVLAADGRVDSSEMETIEQIATTLDLDVKEVERIRDQKLIGLAAETIATANSDDMLGLKREWDKDTIQRHLRGEFQKWNGRLNSLADGPERQNAQRMLDMIAEARKKHA